MAARWLFLTLICVAAATTHGAEVLPVATCPEAIREQIQPHFANSLGMKLMRNKAGTIISKRKFIDGDL